jgi:hypothetical protein
VDEYLGFWRTEIGQARQIKRADGEDYWARLIEHEIVRPDGRREFRRHFDDTRRQDDAAARAAAAVSMVARRRGSA